MDFDLSKRDMYLMLDIIHASLSCRSDADFQGLIDMTKSLLEFSKLSFAGEKCDRSHAILEYLSPHLCQAIKSVVSAERKTAARLTPRECEVLSWTAAGKTAWEASQIMKISRRTVEFHMGNILNKLDAVNSQQAIAIALSSGMITY